MAKAKTTIDLTGLKSIDESSTTFSNNGNVFVDLTDREQGFIDAVSQGIIEIVTK